MARKVAGVAKATTKQGERWSATAYDPELKRKVRVKDPRTGATTFPTQAAAIAAKEHFELIKHSDAGHHRPWTADAWVTEWTTNPVYKRPSSTTDDWNHERVKKFATDFEGVLLDAIGAKAAREWAAENRGRVAAVRTMLNDAVKDQLIDRNPFANLGLKQSKGRKNIEPLTADEVSQLARTADEMFPGWPVLSGMILVAAYAGLRLGEVIALRWSDIDWEQGEIHVTRQYRRNGSVSLPKSGEARTIVMLGPAADAIRAIPKNGPEGLVFYSRRDAARISHSIHTYFWSPVRAAFYAQLPAERQAKIGPSLDFHELRHFCGSYLADHGVSAMDIALQLGHTDGGRLAQELYIHSYEDNARERIRRAGTLAQASGQN